MLETKGKLPEIDKVKVRQVSWWLAGLAVLCDWLGSNTVFFPPCDAVLPLADYWHTALDQAEHAIAATELVVEASAQEQSLQALFAPDIEQPTPLQALCGKTPIAQGPQLYILEDGTIFSVN